MGRTSSVSVLLVLSLLTHTFSHPVTVQRIRRQSSDSTDPTSATSTIDNSDSTEKNNDISVNFPPPVPYNDDDDDDGFDTYPSNNASSGGGSNFFSLLNLVTGLVSGSSTSSEKLQKFFKELSELSGPKVNIRREYMKNEKFYIEHIIGLKPPHILSEHNKSYEVGENAKSDSNMSGDDSSGLESLENSEEKNQSNEESSSNSDSNEDLDGDDEPPGGGDGAGGGLLGLLAGLSGGEDGQSDLGSLLATVSGIIVNLSGDGIDLNSLIASGIGLFVGLLSEGEKNPGEILASYLLTSLDTITGGGTINNGAFFGKFLSKLVKGTSASQGETTDEPAPSPFWTLKLDILRALLQFGTSLLGLASSSSSSSVFSASSG